MTSEIVSVLCGGMPDGPKLPCGAVNRMLVNTDNRISPCQAYQQLLEGQKETGHRDIIIYIHDDVTIHDPLWEPKVMEVFENHPNCVAVGLGGALALGSWDMYRKPWNIWAMARRGYASNQTDAEVHGGRFTGERQVAVLDAFFMAVRTDWLRNLGGWPCAHLTHHGLDLWLACEAARAMKEIWMTGVDCTHHGGGSSTTKGYAGAKWLQGGSMEQDHQLPHRWLWETYRDVLPIETL